MEEEHLKTSKNRLYLNESIEKEISQIKEKVYELVGVKLTEYFDYFCENTIEKLSNSKTYENNKNEIVNFLKTFDSEETHLYVLNCLGTLFQTIRMINPEVNEIVKNLEERESFLRRKKEMINKYKVYLKELNYKEDNWELLECQDPKMFKNLLDKLSTCDRCDILYKKFELLFEGYQGNKNREKYVKPFIEIFLTETNLGVLRTLMVILKPFKFSEWANVSCDKIFERFNSLKDY